MPHHLLGIAEIAAMLGVTRQRVNQLVQADDFPAPEAELSAGRIWSRTAVEAWIAAHPTRATTDGANMFAAFTDATRSIIVRAQEEARRLRHNHLGTEHLLLALLSDVAPHVRRELGAMGVTAEAVAADIVERQPSEEVAPVGHIPFTPRAKDVLIDVGDIAAGGPVEPRHLIVAVARNEDGVAAAVLRGRTQLDQAQLLAELERRMAAVADTQVIVDAPVDDTSIQCSFCGKTAGEVRKVIAGPGVYICNECVDLCTQIIDDQLGQDRSVATRLSELAAELQRLGRDLEAG